MEYLNATVSAVKPVVPSYLFPPLASSGGGDSFQPRQSQLSCQMKWIEETMPSSISPTVKQEFFGGIIGDLKEWLEDKRVVTVSPCAKINKSLMLAAYYAHLSKYSDALEWIGHSLETVKELTKGMREEHARAYSYLTQANFHCVYKRMHDETNGTGNDDASATKLKMISGLFDEKDGGFQAVIAVAKGMVASEMRCHDTQIDMYRKATKLDPNHSEWHRTLYKALRVRRREVAPWTAPSKDEKMAVETAYYLEPGCCLNQANYAGMLDEDCKANRQLYMYARKEEIGDEVVDLFQKALEKNPDDQWNHVRLAEVYASGNYPHLDQLDGQAMFQVCEERWPTSTFVLHKFGKYYFLVNDNAKALDYYTRALECEIRNIPCLLDYLKVAEKVRMGQHIKLQMVEKCVEKKMFFHKNPFTKIMTVYGTLLWTVADDNSKKLEACEAWVEACMKNPRACDHVSKSIKGQQLSNFNITGGFEINIPEVIEVLESLLSLQEVSQNRQDKRKRVIKDLINALMGRNQPSMPTFLPPNGPRRRSTSVSSLNSTMSSSSTCSWYTAKSSASNSSTSSEADLASSWRVGSAPVSSGGIFEGYEPYSTERFASYLDRSYYEPRKARQGPQRRKCDDDDDWRH